ncbi:MAG: hypothetical protein IT463_04030 [Planctomycetes bacterium]|nr:hypothetical protein [Planctomycetota bacterium]
MWLTVLNFTRWLYKTLNADVRPWQVGLGVTLGALAGMLPLGPWTLLAFLPILLVNVNFGIAVLSFGVVRGLAWLLQDVVIRPIGIVTLDAVPHDPVIQAARTPLLALLRLDYFDVAGGLAVWAIMALPLFIAVTALWGRFHARLKQRWANSKLLVWLSRIWLFKLVRYVFIGATA